jgi:hypothetical protein
VYTLHDTPCGHWPHTLALMPHLCISNSDIASVTHTCCVWMDEFVHQAHTAHRVRKVHILGSQAAAPHLPLGFQFFHGACQSTAAALLLLQYVGARLPRRCRRVQLQHVDVYKPFFFCQSITIIQPVALYNNRRYLLTCRLLPKCHFLIGISSLSFFLHGLLLCAEVFGPSTLLTI